MSFQLVVVAGPDKGRSFDLQSGESLLLGRSQATQTRFSDPHVSRVHCEVQAEGEEVSVLDNDSAGGTFVNGKRVAKQPLKPGDVIQIGSTQLRFQIGDSGEAETLAPGSPKLLAALGECVTELSGKLISHFEVGPLLAKGSSSVVFKAQDTKHDKPVALKVLLPEVSQSEEEMQRFVRAMKTMLPVRHPNLVAIYAAGKTGVFCWIAMEYVDGESLRQVIQRIGVAGMLDWRHALRAAIHVSRGLEYAHKHHIVHRNVTPPNILIQHSDKVAKLGDLMLAKALDGTMAQQVTRPGQILGDIAYMSPERTAGTEIDGRSDIYGLGATVYALLTGRPPFASPSLAETIDKIRNAEPERPKKFQLSIPDMFQGTVMRMLAKRPQERQQTATELLAELDKVARFQGVEV